MSRDQQPRRPSLFPGKGPIQAFVHEKPKERPAPVEKPLTPDQQQLQREVIKPAALAVRLFESLNKIPSQKISAQTTSEHIHAAAAVGLSLDEKWAESARQYISDEGTMKVDRADCALALGNNEGAQEILNTQKLYERLDSYCDLLRREIERNAISSNEINDIVTHIQREAQRLDKDSYALIQRRLLIQTIECGSIKTAGTLLEASRGKIASYALSDAINEARLLRTKGKIKEAQEIMGVCMDVEKSTSDDDDLRRQIRIYLSVESGNDAEADALIPKDDTGAHMYFGEAYIDALAHAGKEKEARAYLAILVNECSITENEKRSIEDTLQRGMIHYALSQKDFQTAARVADSINNERRKIDALISIGESIHEQTKGNSIEEQSPNGFGLRCFDEALTLLGSFSPLDWMRYDADSQLEKMLSVWGRNAGTGAEEGIVQTLTVWRKKIEELRDAEKKPDNFMMSVYSSQVESSLQRFQAIQARTVGFLLRRAKNALLHDPRAHDPHKKGALTRDIQQLSQKTKSPERVQELLTYLRSTEISPKHSLLAEVVVSQENSDIDVPENLPIDSADTINKEQVKETLEEDLFKDIPFDAEEYGFRDKDYPPRMSSRTAATFEILPGKTTTRESTQALQNKNNPRNLRSRSMDTAKRKRGNMRPTKKDRRTFDALDNQIE